MAIHTAPLVQAPRTAAVLCPSVRTRSLERTSCQTDPLPTRIPAADEQLLLHTSSWVLYTSS